MHTNFSGVTETLCRQGFHCKAITGEPLSTQLSSARLLIIPPPTGRYDVRHERWRMERSSLFASREIRDVLQFVHDGGSLVAFSYRFGDSFTQTNLCELLGPLGCQLNDDAVLDAAMIGKKHPLELHFDTRQQALPLSWSRTGVETVRWRPCATLTILPGAHAWPLALSSGGGCLSFNRTFRQISFESLPVAVVGIYGRGRFALFGGPHVFETDQFGLLTVADNRMFLQRVFGWLVPEQRNPSADRADSRIWTVDCETDTLVRVDCDGPGERTIASVERLLRRAGVLKALARAKWMP